MQTPKPVHSRHFLDVLEFLVSVLLCISTVYLYPDGPVGPFIVQCLIHMFTAMIPDDVLLLATSTVLNTLFVCARYLIHEGHHELNTWMREQSVDDPVRRARTGAALTLFVFTIMRVSRVLCGQQKVVIVSQHNETHKPMLPPDRWLD